MPFAIDFLWIKHPNLTHLLQCHWVALAFKSGTRYFPLLLENTQQNKCIIHRAVPHPPKLSVFTGVSSCLKQLENLWRQQQQSRSLNGHKMLMPILPLHKQPVLGGHVCFAALLDAVKTKTRQASCMVGRYLMWQRCAASSQVKLATWRFIAT